MKKMTALELMLCVKNERIQIYYHRDTKVFDLMPVSQFELEHIDWDADISDSCKNNVAFLTYQEIDHKDVMSFFVRECVYDKEPRKKLFNILRRHDYVDAFINELQKLELYEEFTSVCGDVYTQIFLEWTAQNGLKF